MPQSLRNSARVKFCRSSECAPDEDMRAAVSVQLGKNGRSSLRGYAHLMKLVGLMKESNVWKGSIKGFFFKGTISTKMKSEIRSFSRVANWQQKTTKRMTKGGILWRTKGKKYLLIFASYRGMGNRIYCSLTVI